MSFNPAFTEHLLFTWNEALWRSKHSWACLGEAGAPTGSHRANVRTAAVKVRRVTKGRPARSEPEPPPWLEVSPRPGRPWPRLWTPLDGAEPQAGVAPSVLLSWTGNVYRRAQKRGPCGRQQQGEGRCASAQDFLRSPCGLATREDVPAWPRHWLSLCAFSVGGGGSREEGVERWRPGGLPRVGTWARDLGMCSVARGRTRTAACAGVSGTCLPYGRAMTAGGALVLRLREQSRKIMPRLPS